MDIFERELAGEVIDPQTDPEFNKFLAVQRQSCELTKLFAEYDERTMLIPPFYTDFGKFSTGLWHAVFIIQALASSDISTGLPERFSLNKAASKPPALYLLMHKRTVFLLTSSFSEKVGYYHGNSDTIRQNSILSRKSLYSQANPIYKYGNCLYDQGNLFNGSFLFAIPEK